MSSAANRNFGLAQRHRERRINADLDNPGLRGVSADPAWDAFWGSLHEKGQQAQEAGLNFRADLSGLGQGGPSLASMRATRPGDQDTARTNAVNEYLGELTDRQRREAQSLRAMTAGADQLETGTSLARGDVADRQTMDRAYAVANTPGVSPYGRPIAQTGPDRYKTAAPDPNAPPVDRRAVLRQQLPGHLQTAEPVAKSVTFGKPEPAMVTGPDGKAKRVFVREGSDGLMYDTARNPIPPEALAPLDEKSDSAKPYFTYQPVFDTQGRPISAIRFDARGGPPQVVDVSELTGGGQLKPPPGTTGQQSIVDEVSTEQLGRLRTMFDKGAKDLIGPVEGRARSMGQQVPGVPVNKDFADFSAASSAFRNSVIKAITGAAMSEPEANRIMKQIPSETDKPDVWLSKYEQTNKNLGDLRKVLQSKSGGAASGAVDMVTPDGRTISVPAGDVDEAKKLGAKPKGSG